jgi:hypothetical protein
MRWDYGIALLLASFVTLAGADTLVWRGTKIRCNGDGEIDPAEMQKAIDCLGDYFGGGKVLQGVGRVARCHTGPNGVVAYACSTEPIRLSRRKLKLAYNRIIREKCRSGASWTEKELLGLKPHQLVLGFQKLCGNNVCGHPDDDRCARLARNYKFEYTGKQWNGYVEP